MNKPTLNLVTFFVLLALVLGWMFWMPSMATLAVFVLLLWSLLLIGNMLRRPDVDAADEEDPQERMCFRCGYDLRASKERCPECGERIYEPHEPITWPREEKEHRVGWPSRVQTYVSRRLRERSEPAAEMWGPNPRRREIAQRLAQASRLSCQWPNTRFLPDDQFSLMWVDNENSSLEVLLQMRRMLKGRFSYEEVQLVRNATFGEAVDFILSRETAQEQPDAERV